jgi:uncharacterized protein YbjT (DUF2867 family)
MILITGATGTVGKEIVKLLARPEERIRVMVRDRNKAASVTYPGVDVVEGDFGRLQTLDDAVAGTTKALLLAPPGEHQPEFESNFATAASRSNLRHIVKISALGADPESPARFLRGHGESERRIVDSGVPYTFLRPGPFMQNFLGFRESIIHKGEFYAPMGEGRVSIVDARDVAAVAAEVLEEFGHENKVYEVTGPESLTYAEMAGALSFELEKPVTYVDVPPEAAGDAMRQSGMTPWMVDGILELYAIWKFNGACDIADTVSTVAKKDPIRFADFAADYAPLFGHTDRNPVAKLMDEINLDNMTPGA